MEKQEQKRIIEEVVENLRRSMLNKLDNIPERWNGNEIRQFAEYKVKEVVNPKGLKGKKLKEFENDLMINDL